MWIPQGHLGRAGQSTFSAGYSGLFCFIKQKMFAFLIYKALDVKIKSPFSTISISERVFLFFYCLREVPESGLGNHWQGRWKPFQSHQKCLSGKMLFRMDKLQPSIMRREKPNPALLVKKQILLKLLSQTWVSEWVTTTVTLTSVTGWRKNKGKERGLEEKQFKYCFRI